MRRNKMSILNDYGKFKRYLLTDAGYQLCSQWTSSNTVHFDDGKTAQDKLGAINGITDSLTSGSSDFALSAKAGKSLQEQISELNTGIAKIKMREVDVVPHKNINFTFKDAFCALFTVNGASGTSFGTYLVQGYGIGPKRITVSLLSSLGADSIRYTIADDLELVTFEVEYDTSVKYTIFMFCGSLPVIAM